MEFIEIGNLPRQAVVSRKVMTRKIKETISEIDGVLNDQLDKLIVLLNAQDPTFVMTYEGARTIIDRPATRKGSTDESDIDFEDGDTS